MMAKMDSALHKTPSRADQDEQHGSTGIIWLLSIVVVGFLTRILIYQFFQWIWQFIEADTFELCQNMGNRSQCDDSSTELCKALKKCSHF